jgi:hypothetical protein
MDMIETYSVNRWGYVKPHAITEYGGIVKNEFTLVRNMQSIRAQNGMIFGLMDREDRLEISIPFNTDEAKWHITKKNKYLPYKAVLWRPENMGVPKSEITGWVYTNRIHFYDIWKDVKGKRVSVSTSNPDIQVQAFTENKQLYVALNNLDERPQKIDFRLEGVEKSVQSIYVKSLTVFEDDLPRYYETTVPSIPSEFFLDTAETIVLAYTLKKPIDFYRKVIETRHYSKEFLAPIEAHKKIGYVFNNVKPNNLVAASLRMSIGRTHDLSKRPIINVNGTIVDVPFNWKGYDQANRKKFFGAIDIPVPVNLIKEKNNVFISFPDSGGHLSTLILDVKTLNE